jgi:hypothetical protein
MTSWPDHLPSGNQKRRALPLLSRCGAESKRGRIRRMTYWETIAENLTKAGFSWGCSSETDSSGRVLYTADAYSRDGRRFIVLSEDRLSAFMELERGNRDDAD